MTITIRPFAIADTQAVIKLWTGCDLIRPWNDPHKDIQRKLSTQSDLFLVACHHDVVVGSAMVGYDGHRGWVYYLAVHPEHQRQGIGQVLMQKAEESLIALACPKIQLLVRKSNSAVVEFYEEQGYEASDVLVLGKRLIED